MPNIDAIRFSMKHVLVVIGIASSCGAIVTKVTLHDNAIKTHSEAIELLTKNSTLLQHQSRTISRVQGQIVRKLGMIERAVTDDEG